MRLLSSCARWFASAHSNAWSTILVLRAMYVFSGWYWGQGLRYSCTGYRSPPSTLVPRSPVRGGSKCSSSMCPSLHYISEYAQWVQDLVWMPPPRERVAPP